MEVILLCITTVVGTRFRSERDWASGMLLQPGDPVHLVREPNNEYDSLAVAVVANTTPSVGTGTQIERVYHYGYIGKQLNPPFAALLDAGKKLRATVVGVVRNSKQVEEVPDIQIKIDLIWE